VTKHLAELFEEHGRPEMIRSDNGRELVAATVKDWLRAQGVEPVFIQNASKTTHEVDQPEGWTDPITGMVFAALGIAVAVEKTT
jgi:hypothetical protein